MSNIIKDYPLTSVALAAWGALTVVNYNQNNSDDGGFQKAVKAGSTDWVGDVFGIFNKRIDIVDEDSPRNPSSLPAVGSAVLYLTGDSEQLVSFERPNN